MKKFLIPFFAIAAILSSCSKEDNLTSGDASTLSTSASSAITAYVANNYPATTIASLTASTSGTSVTLSTGEQITFTADGKAQGYTNNKCKGLKVDSLDTHRPDSIGGHKPGPGIMHHGGKDSIRCDKKIHGPAAISVDSLPITINDYIAANYSGYTVIHARKDTLCAGAVIEVMVCTSTKEPVKLVFDASNSFLMKAERALYADVPTAVSAAVTASYSTYKVMKRCEKFTLANGSIQYKVFMSLDKVRKSVTFNADGTVVCEK